MNIEITLVCPIRGAINCEVEDATFDKLRKLACCTTAELIPLTNKKSMMIDEDGLFKENIPTNKTATAIVNSVYKGRLNMSSRGIVGTVVIAKDSDLADIPYI